MRFGVPRVHFCVKFKENATRHAPNIASSTERAYLRVSAILLAVLASNWSAVHLLKFFVECCAKL